MKKADIFSGLGIFMVAIVWASGARAQQGSIDAEINNTASYRAAPSLVVATDATDAHYELSLTADIVAAVAFEIFALRTDVALGRAHSVGGAIGWNNRSQGLYVEIGYRYWLLGSGVSGLLVGAAFVTSIGVQTEKTPQLMLGGVFDVGYRYIWHGLVIGVNAGLGAQSHTTHNAEHFMWRIGLETGYAWM